MSDVNKSWKERFKHGFIEYIINFIYLTFVFAAFSWYKRLILAVHEIEYVNYGVALLEALVLAKIIMIGDALRLGKGFEERPLIMPTLYRTLIFGIWIAAFKIVEFFVRKMIHGTAPVGAYRELGIANIYEMLARCLMMITAVMSFFAVKVLAGTMGEGRLFKMFFQNRR